MHRIFTNRTVISTFNKLSSSALVAHRTSLYLYIQKLIDGFTTKPSNVPFTVQ